MKDLVIIGSGPAGLSAAIYAKRAAMDVVLVEKEAYSGGQIVNAEKVDNYLGLNGVSGYELATRFREHVDALGVEFIRGEAAEITEDDNEKTVKLSDGREIKTSNIIIATGAGHKKLGAIGEMEFTGLGVSYCATCDGAFFRNRDVAVVGGGNTALQEALYLSGICGRVYLINRRKELRASKSLQDKVFSKDNITFLPDYNVRELKGSEFLEAAVLQETASEETREISVSGLFVAVGMAPATDFVKSLVNRDERGYIIAGEDCRSNVPGIYAAGDCRTKAVRQLITAAADGAAAVSSIEHSV